MNQKISFNLDNFSFIVIPLVTLIFIPNINQSSSVPKVFALLICTIILCITYKFNFSVKNFFEYLVTALVIYYAIIQILNPQDFISFLFGNAGRGGGFISIFCLTLISLIVLNSTKNLNTVFVKTFIVTYRISLVYGLFQIFKILPLEYSIQFQALTLTLDNPNFASAYLGIGIGVTIILLLEQVQSRTLTNISFLLLAVFELYETRSLQGGFVAAILLLFYLLRYLKSRSNLKITIFISVFTLVILALTSFLSWDWLKTNGSISQRFSYWQLGWEIFRDNWLIGIGLDNIGHYSKLYRTSDLSLQEGVFTVVDRSHNVIIDHFLYGGIFSGLLWFSIVTIITFNVFSNIRRNNYQIIETDTLVVHSIWLGYLAQSLISPDHVALTLIGYLSAALVIKSKLAKEKNQD